MRFEILGEPPGVTASKQQPIEVWLESEGPGTIVLKARNSETAHVNVLVMNSEGLWLCLSVSEHLGLPLDHLGRVRVRS